MRGIGRMTFKEVAIGSIVVLVAAFIGPAWAEEHSQVQMEAPSSGVGRPCGSETIPIRPVFAEGGLACCFDLKTRPGVLSARSDDIGVAVPAVAERLSTMVSSRPKAPANSLPPSKNAGESMDIAAVVSGTSSVPTKPFAEPLPAGWWGCLADCLGSAGIGLFDVLVCGATCAVAVVGGAGAWGCAICVGVGVGLVGLCGHLCLIYA